MNRYANISKFQISGALWRPGHGFGPMSPEGAIRWGHFKAELKTILFSKKTPGVDEAAVEDVADGVLLYFG